MHTSAHVPSNTGAHKNDASSTSSTVSSTKHLLCICWAICSTFWYEFKTVVPKGYTRFLGKLSELTDIGVEVHFFTGNHDIWCGDYLTKECGVIMHREPLTTEIYGKEFYLAHGDGLGDPDKKFKFLRSMFHNEFLQVLFFLPYIPVGVWNWD